MTKLGGPGWGGAHKVSVMLANYLAQNGYDVSFAVSEESSRDYPIDPSIKVICLSDFYKPSKQRFVSLLQKMKAFRRLCKKEQIDVVVGFTSNMAIYSVLATVFSKRKALISERTDPHVEPRKKWMRGLRNLLFCFADHVVFQTPGAQAYYPKMVQKKSSIIPNPIAASLPDAFDGVREHRIVNYCRIAPQKNLKVLFDAFDMFAQTHPDYVLEIYGNAKDGSTYLEDLRRYAAGLSVGDRIHLCDACTDVHQKVRNAMVFASSSDYEGMSNSMLEALAIGMPVVVTDCQNGGERMCIQDGENGLIVPRRDPKALADALSRIADDERFVRKLSQNAVAIKERFSQPKIFGQWSSRIEQMTKEG